MSQNWIRSNEQSIVEDLRSCKNVIHNVKGAINKKLSDSSDEPSSTLFFLN